MDFGTHVPPLNILAGGIAVVQQQHTEAAMAAVKGFLQVNLSGMLLRPVQAL